MSSPMPGEDNLVGLAQVPRSNHAATSCIAVDPELSFDASKQSMTQLLTSFGQSLRRVSGLSKRSAPEILPAMLNTAP
jgi:hypothetical protein